MTLRITRRHYFVSQNWIKCTDFTVTEKSYSDSIKQIRYCLNMKRSICTVVGSLGSALVQFFWYTDTSISNTANPAQNTS